MKTITTFVGVFALASLLSACATADPETATRRSGSKTDKTVPGVGEKAGTEVPATGTGAPPAPVPCDPAETEQLKQAVIENTPSQANSGVAVTTKCGLRFFAAGPSSIGPNTLHRIGSISKTYVGALMLLLAREGTLRLDDTVARWISGVPNGGRITIRQLLTHHSGLFNYTEDRVLDAPRTWRPEELLDIVKSHAPIFEPGARFEYCNSGFLLAGMIAQVATGRRLSTLLHERILAPLGLKQTFFSPDDSTAGLELAPAVSAAGEDFTHITDASWAWGAGSMMATPSDVARWIEALAGTHFFDAAAEAELLALSPTSEPTVFYGLGIWQAPSSIGTLIYHRGDLPGYHSSAAYAPEHEVTVVAIVDRQPATDVPSEALPISNAIFNIVVPH